MTMTSPSLRKAGFAALVLLCSCSPVPPIGQVAAPAKATANRAMAVVEEIKTRGAKAVVDRLASPNSEKEWEEIQKGIQTGQADWLSAARELRNGSDAGMTESIDISLAIALSNNAEGVLEVAGDTIPADRICTVPYIEPDATTVVSHKRKAKAALERVARADLASKRDACLAAIENTK